jgi:hypothetical protein
MIRTIKNFSAVLLLALLLLPSSVSAQQGLIVCGEGPSDGFKTPCTFADFMLLAERINDFLLKTVMIPLATFAFGMAGVYYIWGATSGESGKISTASNIFWWTVQGVILASAAWVIVNTLLSFLVTGDFNLLGPNVSL